MDLLSSLNKVQKDAVTFFAGPAIVLSGPGSGKTRVITHRIAYLIRGKGVATENILAVTFTNKAANEIKERIANLLKSTKKEALPTAGTFHSICARILRKDGSFLSFAPNFVILDEDESLTIVKECLKNLDIDPKRFSPQSVTAAIESAKNELVNENDYVSFARGFFQEEIVSKVYFLYQKKLKENMSVDFQDLLALVIILFKEFPAVLKKYQDLWQYILVDEYQDTNKAQYELTKILSSSHKNIFVVGDASQAIYGWRGADFRNILNFSNDFPNAKVFNLEQNYRSTKKILSAASAIISQNRTHPILDLWTENKEGEPLIIYEAENEVEEASFVSRLINRLIRSTQGFSFHSFAVLYRTNAQSRIIEEVFLREGIPYTLVGGVRFYDRKEIKDIMGYLRLIANPADQLSFKRVVNVPPRGIGQATLQQGGEKIEEFKNLISALRRSSENLSTIEIIDLVIEQTKYLEWLDDGGIEAAARVENVKELRSVATEFPTLVDFLENVALVEREYGPEKPTQKKVDAVTLMTAHAAKGLEFPIVFMIGMEEGLFPHNRSLLDTNELEEERRLCYVGITRAKNQLYLTYATRRLYFGQQSEGAPSRFLADIPERLITRI
ncbi:MAG: hypothetical protein A2172_01080 [Candidatus Woykebacteria bacterium RBG_13_40_15]|uniref:DNA 3'-5' helicase n=1 Tax=Candidatus Woykebacteria bacterium RBG_13_40_15 TaxID=1802593 RepID=A0A1G1W9A1_9BACT|nr:MAG: hypothetical protein A2172_01080 [Candidatus Woykebacteria bacterium RBG_13_40_15]